MIINTRVFNSIKQRFKIIFWIQQAFYFNSHTLIVEHEGIKTKLQELFKSKKGAFHNWLSSIRASPKIWEKRNNSYDAFKGLDKQKILFVHNTFSKRKDI